jgi:hypothetical protein
LLSALLATWLTATLLPTALLRVLALPLRLTWPAVLSAGLGDR